MSDIDTAQYQYGLTMQFQQDIMLSKTTGSAELISASSCYFA